MRAVKICGVPVFDISPAHPACVTTLIGGQVAPAKASGDCALCLNVQLSGRNRRSLEQYLGVKIAIRPETTENPVSQPKSREGIPDCDLVNPSEFQINKPAALVVRGPEGIVAALKALSTVPLPPGLEAEAPKLGHSLEEALRARAEDLTSDWAKAFCLLGTHVNARWMTSLVYYCIMLKVVTYHC